MLQKLKNGEEDGRQSSENSLFFKSVCAVKAVSKNMMESKQGGSCKVQKHAKNEKINHTHSLAFQMH